jgi:hypothetical protein
MVGVRFAARCQLIRAILVYQGMESANTIITRTRNGKECPPAPLAADLWAKASQPEPDSRKPSPPFPLRQGRGAPACHKK